MIRFEVFFIVTDVLLQMQEIFMAHILGRLEEGKRWKQSTESVVAKM